MKLGDYCVAVLGGCEQQSGYVEMKHNQVYELLLRNEGSRRVDAHVEIDGKHIGTWRLNGYTSIKLERPTNETGRFTFYQIDTPEARAAGLVRNDQLGLVSVIFTPEIVRGYRRDYVQPACESAPAPRCKSYAGGGTGLSGHSNQRFISVEEIEYDLTAQVTVNLRLVGTEQYGIRPLKPLSTPIPPPVI